MNGIFRFSSALLFSSALVLGACTQKTLTTTQPPTTSEVAMDTKALTNPTVKAAIDALQTGDKAAWLLQFSDNVKLYDDGNERDFKAFSNSAIGHERFSQINKVDNSGLNIHGQFHSDRWGDFKTYFKFQINAQGKINRLDIGQDR